MSSGVSASRPHAVLFRENGTGKELLAPLTATRRAGSHRRTSRRRSQTSRRNVRPDEAFTGADRPRVGRRGAGTLFQRMAARSICGSRAMLQEVVQRLGGGPSRRVDVRVVAATNRDLEGEVQDGRFREDLFYRLNVFPVTLPPLRERTEDIPQLADYFLRRAAPRLGRRFVGIERTSLGLLQQHSWPGNVRQLQNVVERCALLCDGAELQVAPAALGNHGSGTRDASTIEGLFAHSPTLEEVKKRYISHLLTATHGNMLRAAAILDVDRRSLYRMVARYRLGAPALHRDPAAGHADEEPA